jgi:hypothetical protein
MDPSINSGRTEEYQQSIFNVKLYLFLDQVRIIITNAYEKKSQKMPIKERLKALKLRIDYVKRSKDENYY